MPGRYTLVKKPISIGTDEPEEIPSAIVAEDGAPEFQPRYNIAPTQENWIVRRQAENQNLVASLMRWGLVPSWSKSGTTQSLLINARSETIAEKPSFKAAYQRRRCLVPADGYYEWKRRGKANQPYYLQLEDEGVFYMAGIWETWHDPAGNASESYAILTTQANDLVAKIHERMPVILIGGQALDWLVGAPELLESDQRFQLFAPIDDGLMKCRPVNPIVNNNQNDTPDCLLDPPVEATRQLDMGF